MTKRDWAILGCRILAMYLFITGLSSLVQVLGLLGVGVGQRLGESVDFHQSRQVFWLLTLQPLLTLVFACLVWWQAPDLARKVLDETPQAAVGGVAAPGGLDRQGATEVAFVVLGVYLLIKGFSHLVPGVFGMIWGVRGGLDWRHLLVGLLVPGLLVILGLCLVAGGRGIASLVTGLRSVGTQGADAQGSERTGQVVLRPLAIVGALIVAALLIAAGLAVGRWLAGRIP